MMYNLMYMLYQIPDFPDAAQDNYPLLITMIIYTLVLLGGFAAVIRYSIATLKDISNGFLAALKELSAHNDKQTELLLEIKTTVVETNDNIANIGTKKKRGV